MVLLAIGDICGAPGIEIVRRKLGALRRQWGVDLCVINGENAHVRGIAPEEAQALFAAGADVVTLGNHAFDDKRIFDTLEERSDLIRPWNMPDALPGRGWTVVDCRGGRVCVGCLQGRASMDFHAADPFAAADRMLREVEADYYALDFHAETTSEKLALANYLDGRFSAIWGTHTHIPTADNRVLPGGTGYITDLGMTGPFDSVIGVKKEQSIQFFRTMNAPRFQSAENDVRLQGALFTLEHGLCRSVERVEVV